MTSKVETETAGVDAFVVWLRALDMVFLSPLKINEKVRKLTT